VGRKRKKLPLFENVTISDVAAEGKAIAKIDDIIIFVQQAIPGDIVDLQITKKRKKYMEAMVVKVRKYADNRVEPFCSHFGVCGGCKWQQLPYADQLKYKQKQVEDTLTRIGDLQLPEITPIAGSDKTEFYRNKIEFTFSNKRWLTKEEISSDDDIKQSNALGFHVPKMFDKIVDINKCYLQTDPSNQIRDFIREYALGNSLTFFDIKNHEGFLRNLIIRTSTTGDLMVILAMYHEDKEKREKLLDALYNEFPQITSLLYVINGKANDTITDQDIITYKGNDHIYEQMEGLKFKIGPKSFYQTNSEQAYELYKITRDFAGLTGNEIVYDLYTGTGTIANFVARQSKKVIGIEYIPEAIEDADINSANNSINNTTFFAGDMKDVLTDSFIAKHGAPDVIICDPPRAGMHETVVNTILNTSPKRIVYVSCNPATQARDLKLMNHMYKITRVQPVDMFPHTHHVENVVQLEIIDK